MLKNEPQNAHDRQRAHHVARPDERPHLSVEACRHFVQTLAFNDQRHWLASINSAAGVHLGYRYVVVPESRSRCGCW